MTEKKFRAKVNYLRRRISQTKFVDSSVQFRDTPFMKTLPHFMGRINSFEREIDGKKGEVILLKNHLRDECQVIVTTADSHALLSPRMTPEDRQFYDQCNFSDVFFRYLEDVWKK